MAKNTPSPGRTGAGSSASGLSGPASASATFVENPVEVADIVGPGPLLRTENRRRPMRAEQRVDDVARESIDIGQPRIQPAEISSVKIGQSGRVQGQLAAVGPAISLQAGQHARPQSVVALPPSPIMKRLAALSRASRIRSATPSRLLCSTSRSSG